MTPGSVRVGDLTLGYRAAGSVDRPALILLHGWPRATGKSAGQVKAAAREKLPIPLLFLGGELTLQDKFGPFLSQIATNSRATTVPRSGRWMPEENPSFVVEQLQAFFG